MAQVFEDRKEAEATGDAPLWAGNIGAGGTIYAVGDPPGPDPETGDQLDWVEVVPEGAECPECGEDRMDYLTLAEEGDWVTCRTCGYIYNLGEEDRDEGQ